MSNKPRLEIASPPDNDKPTPTPPQFNLDDRCGSARTSNSRSVSGSSSPPCRCANRTSRSGLGSTPKPPIVAISPSSC